MIAIWRKMQSVIRINQRFRAFTRWRNSWFIVDFQFCYWYIFCDSEYYQLHFSPNRNHVNLYRLVSNTNSSFLVTDANFLLLCECSWNQTIFCILNWFGVDFACECAFSEWDRKRCHDVMICANSVIKKIIFAIESPAGTWSTFGDSSAVWIQAIESIKKVVWNVLQSEPGVVRVGRYRFHSSMWIRLGV
jgi:hypothetical protein